MVAMLDTFLKKDTTFFKTSELFEVPIANDWIYQNDCLDISSPWQLVLFSWTSKLVKLYL